MSLLEKPTRKQIRVEEHDYSANGGYFVTICTKERHEILGNICAGKMVLSEIGSIVESEIAVIESVYPTVMVDAHVVMPNHVHMLFVLLNASHNPTISRIIQQWKGAVSKKAGFSLWQYHFHDHIISDTQEYRNIRSYIQMNPENWDADRFYPKT